MLFPPNFSLFPVPWLCSTLSFLNPDSSHPTWTPNWSMWMRFVFPCSSPSSQDRKADTSRGWLCWCKVVGVWTFSRMNLCPDSWNALGLVQGIWWNVTANLIQGEALEHWTTTSDLQFREALKLLLHPTSTSPVVTACLLAPLLPSVPFLCFLGIYGNIFLLITRKGYILLIFL